MESVMSIPENAPIERRRTVSDTDSVCDPGKAGVPGELQGVIHYEEKNRIGSVAENTIYGIHGVLDREKAVHCRLP